MISGWIGLILAIGWAWVGYKMYKNGRDRNYYRCGPRGLDSRNRG